MLSLRDYQENKYKHKVFEDIIDELWGWTDIKSPLSSLEDLIDVDNINKYCFIEGMEDYNFRGSVTFFIDIPINIKLDILKYREVFTTFFQHFIKTDNAFDNDYIHFFIEIEERDDLIYKYNLVIEIVLRKTNYTNKACYRDLNPSRVITLCNITNNLEKLCSVIHNCGLRYNRQINNA